MSAEVKAGLSLLPTPVKPARANRSGWAFRTKEFFVGLGSLGMALMGMQGSSAAHDSVKSVTSTPVTPLSLLKAIKHLDSTSAGGGSYSGVPVTRGTVSPSKYTLAAKCVPHKQTIKKVINTPTAYQDVICYGGPTENSKWYTHSGTAFRNFTNNHGEQAALTAGLTDDQHGTTNHIVTNGSTAEIFYNNDNAATGEQQVQEVILRSGEQPQEVWYS